MTNGSVSRAQDLLTDVLVETEPRYFFYAPVVFEPKQGVSNQDDNGQGNDPLLTAIRWLALMSGLKKDHTSRDGNKCAAPGEKVPLFVSFYSLVFWMP